MQLTIINRQNLNLDSFCTWLVSIVKKILINSLNEEKLAARDDKINNLIDYIIKQKLTATTVIKIAINNLEWRRRNGSTYELFINDKVKLYGTNTRVYELAKYIEYGSKGIQPLYLFRLVFDKVAKSLPDYYNQYDILKGEEE